MIFLNSNQHIRNDWDSCTAQNGVAEIKTKTTFEVVSFSDVGNYIQKHQDALHKSEREQAHGGASRHVMHVSTRYFSFIIHASVVLIWVCIWYPYDKTPRLRNKNPVSLAFTNYIRQVRTFILYQVFLERNAKHKDKKQGQLS